MLCITSQRLRKKLGVWNTRGKNLKRRKNVPRTREQKPLSNARKATAYRLRPRNPLHLFALKNLAKNTHSLNVNCIKIYKPRYARTWHILGGNVTVKKGNIENMTAKYNRISYKTKPFVFASLDSTAFISPKCNCDVNFSYSSYKARTQWSQTFAIFSLACAEGFRKGKGKRFSDARGEERGTLFLSPSHVRARAPKFLCLPFRRPASQTIFFLDSLWCRCHLCVCFVPRYHRTIRNTSKFT